MIAPCDEFSMGDDADTDIAPLKQWLKKGRERRRDEKQKRKPINEIKEQRNTKEEGQIVYKNGGTTQ